MESGPDDRSSQRAPSIGPRATHSFDLAETSIFGCSPFVCGVMVQEYIILRLLVDIGTYVLYHSREVRLTFFEDGDADAV